MITQHCDLSHCWQGFWPVGLRIALICDYRVQPATSAQEIESLQQKVENGNQDLTGSESDRWHLSLPPPESCTFATFSQVEP